MFSKNKTDMQLPVSNGNGGGATLISAGTVLEGNISSSSDLRIDGTVYGNVKSGARIIVGGSGVVEGDVSGNQADINGRVKGNIHTQELLQLRGECRVTGNIYAGKLQVEPTATFNGQCHMGKAENEKQTDEQEAGVSSGK